MQQTGPVGEETVTLEATGNSEAQELRRCVRDLVALSALPALWTRWEPGQIAGSLAEVLARTLALDFVYVRLNGFSPIDAAYAGGHMEPAARAEEIGRALTATLTDPAGPVSTLPNPAGRGTVRACVVPIGANREWGWIAAGSNRDDSLTELDLTLLKVLANQAAVALKSVQLMTALRDSDRQKDDLLNSVRAAQEQLRNILEGISDSFIFLDREWRYRFLNRRAAEEARRTLGKSPEELLGRVVWELFPDAVQSKFYAELLRAVEQQVAVHFEEYYAPGDTWLEVHAYPSRDGLSVWARDITEAKRAQQARLELAAVVESSEDAIISKTLDGVIFSWNRGAEKIYGYTASDVIGRHVSILAPSGSEPEVASLLERLRRGETIEQYEMKCRRKDGAIIDVSVTISPVAGETGGVAAACVVARDITRRKQAERRVAANLAITQILAESPSLDDAIPRILQTVSETTGWEVSGFWLPELSANVLRCLKIWHDPSVSVSQFATMSYQRTFAPGIGLPGRVWSGMKPAWIPDVVSDDNFARAPVAVAEGLHAGFAFPIVLGEKFLGVMEFFSREIRQPDEDLLAMFQIIGGQIGHFLERKRAEEALRENEERLRFALSAARMSAFEWDFVTGESMRSMDALGLWGLTTGPAEQFWNLIHPEDRAGVEQAVARALAGESAYEADFRLVRSDGQTRWVGAKGRVHRGADGRPLRLVGVTADITERKQAEAALREGEQRERARAAELQTIMEAVPAAIFIAHDPRCEVITGNAAGYELLRLPRGANASKSAPEGERPENFEALCGGRVLAPEELPVQRAARGEEIRDFEEELRYEDGTSRYLVGNASPLRDAQGNPRGAVAAFLDITARKQAEENLRLTIESAPHAIIVANQQGSIVMVNAQTEKSFGYARGELLGQPIEILVPERFRQAHPAHRKSFQAQPTSRPMGMGRDLYGRRKDGSEFPVEIGLNPFQTQEGSWVLSTIVDITQRKHAEEERARLLASEQAARAEAERASSIKDEFLATVSHELRTPLTAMLGWARLLRSGSLDETTGEGALEIIERNARAQAKLIEDILDVSRIVSGKLNVNFVPVDLQAILDRAVDTIRPAAEAKRIRMEKAIEQDVGKVLGDPDRLQQVVWNLLSNAVKFTPEAGRVDVRLRRLASNLEIEVKDTGKGIPAEFLPHVFEPFRQADASPARGHGGLGLGLAIVRRLVELHNGAVQADSAGPGKGATFMVRLPQLREQAADPRAPEALPESSVSLHGVRVLVVEDDPDAQNLLRILLESSGAEVRAVASAREVREVFDPDRTDILVCDIGLPGEDGYTVIRRIRALGAAAGGDTPAIAVTAYARPEDRQQALAAGYQIHLPKPIDPLRLARSVQTLARERRDRSATA